MRIFFLTTSFFKEKWLILLLSIILSGPAVYFFLKDVHYLDEKVLWEKEPRKNTLSYEFEGEVKSLYFLKWESTLQIMSFDSDRSVINQWNIGGRISDLDENSILIEDIDGDQLPDLSFLHIIENKVYLAIVPISLNTNYYHRYFLDSIQFSEMDSKPIYLSGIKTLKIKNSDQKNVAVFIYMGHAKYPRKLYLIDFPNDKVISSQTDGNGLSNLNIEDVDGDSLPEFFGESSSPGNMRNHSELAFHDSSTYLMVFDENLEFEFPPIEFETHFSRQSTFSFATDSGFYFFTSIIDNSSPRKVYPAYLYDVRGKLVDSLFIGSNTKPSYFRKESSGIYAFTNEKEIFRIVDFRNPEYLTKIDDLEPNYLKFAEIENKNGFFFQMKENKLLIYNSDFKLLEKLETPFTDIFELRITNFAGNTLEKGKLLLQDKKYEVLLQYKKNIFWEFRFIILPAFIILGFYIMNILAFLLSYEQNRRFEREKEITELRFNAIKNQLEPHFLFNSLNSIGHLLLTEDRLKAYSYLESLSFLLRNAVNNSGEIAVSIKDEILFTKKYLEIEKLRFEDKFNFKINVDEDVNTEFPIPKMIIQLHSENAVKHGVLHRETGGEIEIRVRYESENLIIEIDDNGAGRSAPVSTQKNLGKGLLLSEQMLELYQKVMKNAIQQEIIDKKDSQGNALGTLIIIRILKAS
ncbi:MAG: histidine kinase [Bacteroidales bacterium]|nr:histidine kinase [Bacteroidales bacterium]MCF8389489.1 histidine kinase [Bacteroidales bacterium]